MWKFKNQNYLGLTILFIFILNIVTKIIGLTTNCLSLDEPFSVFYAQMNVKDIILELLKGNNPPLWEIILHYWIRVFGTGIVSVRFLPLIFSSLTAVILFITGKRFFNYQVGITASLLFTFSNYHVFFSHEARVYPLFCLLTVISVYYFLSYIKQPHRWKYLIIITVTNIVICYAHYFGFFVLFIEFLWALCLVKFEKRIFYTFLLSIAVFLVAYIPIINIFIARLNDSVSHGTWLSPVSGDSWFFLLGFWSNNRVNLILFLIPLLLSLVLLIKKLIHQYQQTIFTALVFSWFWIPFLLMYFISFRIPMFLDRYLIYISPAFYLILPISLNMLQIKPVLKKTLLYVSILLMMVSFKFNISNEREFDKIAVKIKELKKPGTEVYFCPPWFDLNIMYYCDSTIFHNAYGFNSLMTHKEFYPIYNFEGLHSETLLKKQPLMFIDCNSKFAFSGNTILEVLLNTYKSSEKFEYASGFSVYYFHE